MSAGTHLPRPEPLGATADDAGVNFAVASEGATAIEVCLYADDGVTETSRHLLGERLGPVHYGRVDGIGPGTRYGLRAHGRNAPAEGLRFNPAKLLVDPYALALDRPFHLHPALFETSPASLGTAPPDADSGPHVPKALVPGAPPPPAGHRPFRWGKEIIYELHVRGFTKLCPDIPETARGTFAGLGHPAAIAHLKRIGVTAVELLPCMAWIDERHLHPLGLINYWGYNPVGWMVPDPRLAPGGWDEVRAATEALHEAGIAVLLDVVFNHTGEGDHLGPTLSLRGLDNAMYYRLRRENPARYVDDSGCGNTMALDRPVPLRLVLDTLRTWVLHGGIDGFRYDLATTLIRRENDVDVKAPLLAAIEQDPVLRDVAHIAEPWDIGPGGYQLGAFPAGWGEWNDRFRDDVRRFWRGEAGRIGSLATALAGSADIFAPRHRGLSRSLNFVTAHDGFTLADLVSYRGKHNEANGEHNRDGTDHNNSWSHGSEGPTDDPAIRALRQADVRGMLATLIFARGTPMLSMGDEAGRSQGGNNNAYCQDNAVSWLDWANLDQSLIDYTAALTAARREIGPIDDEDALSGRIRDSRGVPDVAWLTESGAPMQDGDWHDAERRRLAMVLDGGAAGTRAALLVNHTPDAVTFALPPPRTAHDWRLVIDSAAGAGSPADAEGRVGAHGVALWTEVKGNGGRGARAASPDLLARVADAAGIATDWHDINGQRHEVPAETLRITLAALGFPAETQVGAEDSLSRLSARGLRSVAPATHAWEGRPVGLDIVETRGRSVTLTLTREDGSEETFVTPAQDALPFRRNLPDGRVAEGFRVLLPPQLPGIYRIRRHEAGDGEGVLTVAPWRCHEPDEIAEGGRGFGIAAQLYSVRGQGEGIGNFGTLAELAAEAARAGAWTVAVNPFHALFPEDRERASPYSPADRRFIDPVYIDVTDVTLAEGPLAQAALAAEGPLLAGLAARPSVNYPAVWAGKRRVLDAAFEDFLERARRPGSDPAVRAFAAFKAAGGEALARFATFEALSAQHGPDVRRWPAEAAGPSGAAARQAASSREADFAAWLQFVADRQLGAAAAAGREAGLGIGLFRDLAVGTVPDGAEVWGDPGAFLKGLSVGAPPDPLGPLGQVWGLAPPNPLAMEAGGYAGFGGLIAANMRHAGALRIDHVMALTRLFVVPEGATAAEGAYLAMPREPLLARLILESRRARCLVLGEDLGTVPHGIRERLGEAGVLTYRVLPFEREGRRFRSPMTYPANAVACVATHDLSPVAGWWKGVDIDERLRLGLVTADEATASHADRQADKAALMDALREAGEWSADGPVPEMTPALAAAIHGFLAAGPSAIMLVQADDLAGAEVGVNLPGTDRERPNWRARLPVPAAELFRQEPGRSILAAVRARRGAAPAGSPD